MPGCTAPNCTNSSQKGFKLYHFPTDKERNAIWVKNCGREEGWQPTRHTCICEVHFEESEFELHRADGLRKLKPYAVPTKFNHSKFSYRPTNKRVRKSRINELSLEEPECVSVKKKVKFSNDISEEYYAPIVNQQSDGSKKRKLDFPCIPSKKFASNHSENKSSTGKKVVGTWFEDTQVCFVCNAQVQVCVALNSCTDATKMYMHQKLAMLVAKDFEMLIEDCGVLCVTCAKMLNYIDRIELNLSSLIHAFLNRLRKKFGMELTVEDDHLFAPENLKEIAFTCLQAEKDEIMSVSPVSSELSPEEVESHALNIENTDVEMVKNNSATKRILPVNHENSDNQTSVYDFSCQICGYNSQYQALMLYHLRQHMKHSFNCDFCNKPLSLKSVPPKLCRLDSLSVENVEKESCTMQNFMQIEDGQACFFENLENKSNTLKYDNNRQEYEGILCISKENGLRENVENGENGNEIEDQHSYQEGNRNMPIVCTYISPTTMEDLDTGNLKLNNIENMYNNNNIKTFRIKLSSLGDREDEMKEILLENISCEDSKCISNYLLNSFSDSENLSIINAEHDKTTMNTVCQEILHGKPKVKSCNNYDNFILTNNSVAMNKNSTTVIESAGDTNMDIPKEFSDSKIELVSITSRFN